MRAIERTLRAHWLSGTPCIISNSAVIVDNRGGYEKVSLALFGNVIAKRVNGITSFTLAGWNTLTTRSRLCHVADIEVSTRKGKVLYRGQEIDSNAWYLLEPEGFPVTQSLTA